MDDKTAQILRLYMEEYHPGCPGPEFPLIYTKYKGEIKQMTHRNIQKILRKHSEGLKCGNVHPHLLRRSRATDLYQNDTQIEIVSVFLGHSSIETTKDHYAFASMEQMKAAMDAGKPSNARREKPLWEGHEAELAKLCGFPGKLGMDGSQVWPAFRDGRLAEIRDYCETDVANTWLMFCRFQRMRGLLAPERYEAEVAALREVLGGLAQGGAAHWREFLDAWPNA